MDNFNIIHHRGIPKQTTTLKGRRVERQEALFVPEWKASITCTPYDDHFIYENPNRAPGASAYMCTCGSPAVVAPPGPEGMFVCLFHANQGAHTTSYVNKRNFPAGQTIKIKENR